MPRDPRQAAMPADAPERVARRRPAPARVVAVLARAAVVAVAVAACSGGGPTGSPAASGPPQPTATAGGSGTRASVDLVDCANVAGSGAASGTIVNDGAEPAAYRIRVAFLDPGGTLLGEGAADTATAAPGAEVPWVVTAAGLGDADVNCRTIEVTVIGSAGTTPGTPAVGEYPCTLVPQAKVVELAGNALEPGDANTIQHDENDVRWTSIECTWLSFDETATEVSLDVAKADGFPAGVVGCPPIAAPSAPLEGFGAPAAWAWVDAGTETTVGELRVCNPAVLVDVRVTGLGGEAALRTVAVEVATIALAAP